MVATPSIDSVRAAECLNNPGALGTSRVLKVDPREFARLGTVQYAQSLPLHDKEVVLTFDDGPMPPYTNRVLEVLADQCVKATFFIIGRMARGYSDLLKKIRAEGHTIGNHSQNHPLSFDRMPAHAVKAEVEQGFASIAAALGDQEPPSPFFRIPGLLRGKEAEDYLQSRGIATWSADVVADDWKHISASELVRRAIARLDEKGKGILLLHDIQPATAMAMPALLRELKAKSYRIVHVVPGQRGVPASQVATAAQPEQRKILASTSSEGPAEAPARESDAPASDEQGYASVVPIVPGDPVRPFTSSTKPARSMPTPGKFVTTEPGGWPPVVSVPLAKAGGVGVSSVPRGSQTPDGRFR
jgi:peptidoglycan/xylan/chitin deacetylase (PgdA/CDA1 family)